MILKIKVTKVNNKPFRSSEGEMINFYWNKGERANDQVSIDFCTTKDHKVGEVFEADFEKQELANGKIRYKELVPRLSVEGGEEEEE